MTERFDADALTIGDDIFFRSGRFDPGTLEGKTLLAHELAHVAQQRKDGAPAARAALETEADLSAATIASGGFAPVRHASATGTPLARPAGARRPPAASPPKVASPPNVEVIAAKKDSPFPGFSQGSFATCGAASVVSALMIWDNETRDPAAPHHLVETACNIILTRLANNRSALIDQWNKAGLKGGLTGQKLHDIIRDTLIQVRDRARAPGSKLTETDYQEMGEALYALYNGKDHGGLTSSDLRALAPARAIRRRRGKRADSGRPPGQRRAGWAQAGADRPGLLVAPASKPNKQGDVALTRHVFLMGRLKSGDWFLSDQGSSPPVELAAPTLEVLKTALAVAQSSGKTSIFRGTPPIDLLSSTQGNVRVLGESTGVDQPRRRAFFRRETSWRRSTPGSSPSVTGSSPATSSRGLTISPARAPPCPRGNTEASWSSCRRACSISTRRTW